jgi:hypothetical protein
MRLPFSRPVRLPITDLRAGTSSLLLSLAVAMVFLLRCSSALYFPRYLNFNPDEARIVISVDHLETGDTLDAGWFAQHPLRAGTHLGSEVQYYLLPRLTPVTVRTLRVLAATFSVLTFAYIIWLSGAYTLFGQAGLLVLMLLISMNGGLTHYGQWGVFDYSERILQSVFLLHVLLFLHKRQLDLSKHALALVLFSLCLFTIGYTALLLPIVVLVVLAFLFRRTIGNDDTRDATKAALRNGLILLIPVITVGLLTLKYHSHPEFLHPRPEIQHFFFPLSAYPKTVAGLLAFLYSTTLSFVQTTFYTFVPLPGSSIQGPSLIGGSGVLSVLVALGFIIGLIRSLFERTRNPIRFVIGAYVLSVVVALIALAVAGIYAFGDVRYALFIHIPLLVLAAYGFIDVMRWSARLLPSSLARRAHRVGLPVFVGVVLVASASTAYVVRSEKSRFNAKFMKIVALIKTDRSPLLFYDTFAEWNLRVLGMDAFPNRRKFLVDYLRPWRPYEAFKRFLTFAAPEQDVLWITYHVPSDEPRFAPYVAQLEKTHFRDDDLSIPPWRVTRWRSWSTAQETVALPLLLDIGDSTARRWMRTGWQHAEVSDGEAFTWSDGDRSVLTIPFPTGADIRMDFDALPFVFPHSPPQRVTIVLNGTVVGQVPLQPGLQGYSVTLPAAALHESLDTLAFRYAYARVAREVLPHSPDERQLAVAWSSITFAAPDHAGDTKSLPSSGEHRSDRPMNETPR